MNQRKKYYLYEHDYYLKYCGGLGYSFVTLFPSLKPFVVSIEKLLEKYYGNNNRRFKVIDIGCARGYLVKLLRDIGIMGFGVDISSYAIATSPKEIREFLYQLDATKEKIPFPDCSIDLCISIQTFEHIHPKQLVHLLKEIRRVLREKGILIINIPNPLKVSEKKRKEHIIIIEKEKWIQLIEKTGFEYSLELTNIFEYLKRYENRLLVRYHVNLLKLIYKKNQKYKKFPDIILSLMGYLVALKRNYFPNDISIVFIKR